MALSMAACAARSSQPATAERALVAPRVSSRALDARPVAWSPAAGAALAVPAGTKHLQVIITRGWARDEHFAWVVADGTEALVVYRARGNNEVSDIIGAIASRTYATMGTPMDSATFGVMGSFHAPPPPPPPEPGGFPGDYVRQVMRAAWGVNHESVVLEAPAVSVGGH